jgi:glutamate dehydrogenase (NAD(P)+)
VSDRKAQSGNVTDYEDGQQGSNEDLLTADVDLLVPAALENAIDADLAEEVQADVIVEAANGPLTPDADDVLTDRDVYVLPDVLANAGGVTVSYFEWVQNRQGFYWSEERVNDELETVTTDAFEDLRSAFEDRDLPNFRMAAYVVALERIVDAYEQGGNWP